MSDSETIAATCNITGAPENGGQTLNAQQTISIQVKKEGTETENQCVRAGMRYSHSYIKLVSTQFIIFIGYVHFLRSHSNP